MPPRIIVLLIAVLFSVNALHAQLIEKNASSNIRQALKKLNTLSSVLYIAAHPDDENTRLIAYLDNELLSRAAYLSLTRGDGGQNLIGNEKGDELGLIRTQELLAARKVDGGEQFFTRAIDFGYSKSAEESFAIWGKEDVLHDVVLVIRQFQPDVIITRFPPTEYAGHGHHTASAMLAEEAFKAAANPESFPEQLEERGLKPWQAKRLYFNASTWWNKDLAVKAAGSDEYVTIDIGTYNTTLGLSYGEIASESRSMHKSQGFGSARQRGSQLEFLQYQQGEKASKNNILDGVNTSWSKYGETGAEIGRQLSKIYSSYDPQHSDVTITLLLEVRKKMRTLNDDHDALLKTKLTELDDLLLTLAGVFFETTSEHPVAARHEKVKLTVGAINRSHSPITLEKIKIGNYDYPFNQTLDHNMLQELPMEVMITEEALYSNPYWLNHPSNGIFQVDDSMLIGLPEHYEYMITYTFLIGDQEVTIQKPVQYKWVDREKGELYRTFVVLPAATVNIADPVYIFSGSAQKAVEVRLEAHALNAQGEVSLTADEKWKISPSSIPFETTDKGETKVFIFQVTPPDKATVTELKAVVNINGESISYRLDEIDYDHINMQTRIATSASKAIKLDIEKKGNKVAYVMGAGDDVPECLRQIGYEVALIEAQQLSSRDLSAYDALIFGVRAFNVHKDLSYAKEQILEYVHSGGRVIVQYNTSRGLDANDFAPYPMQLSRDRVTRENAKVNFNDKRHPAFAIPNKITKADFEGWVQERGLYFADEWDDRYAALISWNDPGEDPKTGSLLVADYGKGAFVYTGISFFRQLPAGVAGAYRLFANLISYTPKDEEQ